MLTMLMEEITKDMYVCQSARKRMLLRTRINRSIIIRPGGSTGRRVRRIRSAFCSLINDYKQIEIKP